MRNRLISLLAITISAGGRVRLLADIAETRRRLVLNPISLRLAVSMAVTVMPLAGLYTRALRALSATIAPSVTSESGKTARHGVVPPFEPNNGVASRAAAALIQTSAGAAEGAISKTAVVSAPIAVYMRIAVRTPLRSVHPAGRPSPARPRVIAVAVYRPMRPLSPSRRINAAAAIFQRPPPSVIRPAIRLSASATVGAQTVVRVAI